MTLTRHKIAQLASALHSLSAEKDGKALFAFSPKVTWNLVKNTRIINEAMEDLETVRVGTVKRLSPAGRLEPGTPEHKAFMEEWSEFMSGTVETVGLLTISPDDLNLEANQIPMGTLGGLDPILK